VKHFIGGAAAGLLLTLIIPVPRDTPPVVSVLLVISTVLAAGIAAWGLLP